MVSFCIDFNPTIAAQSLPTVFIPRIYISTFTRNDYIKGTYIYSWDKHRWERLRRDGWIEVYTKRNHTTIKFNVYKVSTKCKYIISRIYRILLGQEDLPVSRRSVFNKNNSYTDKVFNSAIDTMNKDLER